MQRQLLCHVANHDTEWYHQTLVWEPAGRYKQRFACRTSPSTTKPIPYKSKTQLNVMREAGTGRNKPGEHCTGNDQSGQREAADDEDEPIHVANARWRRQLQLAAKPVCQHNEPHKTHMRLCKAAAPPSVTTCRTRLRCFLPRWGPPVLYPCRVSRLANSAPPDPQSKCNEICLLLL